MDFSWPWPFLICIFLVGFFTVAGVFLLWRYEGGKVSGPRPDELQDACLVGILPIGYLSSEELWKACGGYVHPGWLLGFRGLVFVYLLSIMLYNVVTDGVDVFFYYTQWTFTLLTVYFGLALRMSVVHFVDEHWHQSPPLRSSSMLTDEHGLLEDDNADMDGTSGSGNGKKGAENGRVHVPFVQSRNEKGEAAGVAGYVTQGVFQAVAPAVLLTDLVYWTILVPYVLPPTFHHSFVDINMHAVNAILLGIEFCVNSLRFPWYRISYMIFWSAGYTFFQWTVHTTGISHTWPYPFMNVDTPWAPAWYIFIIVCHAVCYAVCLLLALAKQSVWSRLQIPLQRPDDLLEPVCGPSLA